MYSVSEESQSLAEEFSLFTTKFNTDRLPANFIRKPASFNLHRKLGVAIYFGTIYWKKSPNKPWRTSPNLGMFLWQQMCQTNYLLSFIRILRSHICSVCYEARLSDPGVILIDCNYRIHLSWDLPQIRLIVMDNTVITILYSIHSLSCETL